MDDDELEYKTVISLDRSEVSPPAREDTRAYLVLLAGSNVGEMFALGENQVLGRGKEAELRLRGEGISRQHARLVTTADGSVQLEDLGSTNGTFVNGQRVDRVVLKDGDKIQVGDSIILKFSYQDDLEQTFQRRLYESALQDPLTGIYNKRYFMEQLNLELGFARRHQARLALLLFDLDHFKSTNDTYGHAAGDHVLREMATAVSAVIRREDMFARYGGEEFVVLSRSTDIVSARVVAERIRRTVAGHAFVYEQHPLRVTVSVGVAAYPDIDVRSDEDLVVAADRALYQAKRSGRNRVVAAE
jgi:two-component system cell cycle response regulator